MNTEDSEQLKEEILNYCNGKMAEYKRKADRKKTEALACFVLTLLPTLAVPMFVSLGQNVLLGKVVPSALSLLAAGSTAWLQLRRPQELWSLYRTGQREIEYHVTVYLCHGVDGEATADRIKELGKQVAEIAMTLHRRWEALVPNVEALKRAGRTSNDQAAG